MKKNARILALALIMAIALLGAGYAAWGTDIVATTTLKTGHWEVVLENDYIQENPNVNDPDSLAAGDAVYTYNEQSDGTHVEDGSFSYEHEKYDVINSDGSITKNPNNNWVYTIEPEFSNGDKAVTFQFHNMHPGTKARTYFEIRNKGTIPAKITNVHVDFGTIPAGSELEKLFNAIKVNYTAQMHTGTGNNYSDLPNLPSNEISLSGLRTALYDTFVGQELLPENYVTVGVPPCNYNSDEVEILDFYFKIPADSLYNNEAIDQVLPITVTFEFGQYNENVEAK